MPSCRSGREPRPDLELQRTPPRGSGLGLSMARKIVEAYGGHITLQSEPGNGSQFKIR